MTSNGQPESASLPDGFALSEWLVQAEAAVQSPIGERRILVVSCRGRTAEGTHAAPDAQ